MNNTAKRVILIILSYMLIETTFYSSNETVISAIYILGLIALTILYYKLLELILNETSKRIRKTR